MKRSEFAALPSRERRRFLKVLAGALALPAIPLAFRRDVYDALGVAHAVSPNTPTYFLEVNLRDQWDHAHVMVPPSLASAQGVRRGEDRRQCAVFFQPEELTAYANNVFLTPQSLALAPHLDNIAMIDCCELSVGAIHGHEAGNPMRSPGRGYSSQNGAKLPMFNNDRPSNFPQGCEEFYTSSPTPASLHNYVQKQLTPGLRNGIAFKGISRSIHTAYHTGVGLPGAELDRIPNKDQLLAAFPNTVEDLNILATPAEADGVARLLNRVDARFLERRRFTEVAKNAHLSNLLEAKNALHVGEPRVFSMPLTPEEIAYWSAGVPEQSCNPADKKAEIWEQFGFAYKVLTSGVTRSVALEFDYVDVHDQRTVGQLATETAQCVLPLVRMIESLKAAGIWSQTLIAIYCTDGGRAPAAGSQGNEGKNTVILAGGMIRGGYFGDIRIAGNIDDSANYGHTYQYAAPQLASGAPDAWQDGNDGRLAGKHVWRTVMRALGVDDSVAAGFPDVADGQVLPWLLA